MILNYYNVLRKQCAKILYMYCWINQMHLKSLSIMNLIFYRKCLTPHLPTVTGKGDPNSHTGNV